MPDVKIEESWKDLLKEEFENLIFQRSTICERRVQA